MVGLNLSGKDNNPVTVLREWTKKRRINDGIQFTSKQVFPRIRALYLHSTGLCLGEYLSNMVLNLIL